MKNTIEIVLKMISFAALGAACGVAMVSIGNVLSSSPTTVIFTIVVCALPGIYQRNLVSLILGASSGALLAAFGSLISGNTLGVVMTLSACSLLGVMIGWANYRDTSLQPAYTLSPAKLDIARTIECTTDGKNTNLGSTTLLTSWRWFKVWMLESYDCGEWVYRPKYDLQRSKSII